MIELDENWKPSFGTIYTWFAMDRNGKIAVMVNNCWGDLPQSLLCSPKATSLLDSINEYIWEESAEFTQFPDDKNGELILDMYSAWRNHSDLNRDNVIRRLKSKLLNLQNFNEINLSVNKGFFVFHGIEGNNPGEDYPVGYDKSVEMGDYFRYLIPSVFAGINDFPQALWPGIAVSDCIDFTHDRLLENTKISDYFPRMYSPA